MRFNHLTRREFISLLGGAAAAWPLGARAQQGERVQRIGLLSGTAKDAEGQSRFTAFRRGLQELGWTEGRNLRIDERWSVGGSDAIRGHAAELVGLAPEVILVSSTAALAVLQQETRSIPIVFVQVSDPIGQGFTPSLARPGGNITGFTNFEFSISGKWLELLKEIAPQVRHAAFLFNPATAPYAGAFLRQAEAVGPAFKMTSTGAHAADADGIERTIAALALEPDVGLVVLPDVLTTAHRERIVALAAERRLPAVYPFRFFAVSGGLVSYGVDIPNQWWRAAAYVDRILKGAKPGELPVQQPVKYELVINLKTAKALGLDVPAKLLALADEVIE
jgi:putative ABC transport system substrate-binding protein